MKIRYASHDFQTLDAAARHAVQEAREDAPENVEASWWAAALEWAAESARSREPPP